MSIKLGDEFSDQRSGDAIRELFGMGFFSDVSIDQNADVLIINVTERPAITSIELDGNKDIETLMT